MIVVIDTNVVVSGIFHPYGKPAAILRLVAAGKIQLAYDLRITNEYRSVLRRPHFNFSREQIDAFMSQVEQEGVLVSADPLPFRLPDQSAEPFLEAALSAKATVLITGNKRHFPKKRYNGVKIVSPAEFLSDYCSGEPDGKG
jgi:uncharacterized protein